MVKNQNCVIRYRKKEHQLQAHRTLEECLNEIDVDARQVFAILNGKPIDYIYVVQPGERIDLVSTIAGG